MWNLFKGGRDRDTNEGYEVETTNAYNRGAEAGSRWMNEGGTGNLPNNPYSGTEAEEWENGFNAGAGEEVF